VANAYDVADMTGSGRSDVVMFTNAPESGRPGSMAILHYLPAQRRFSIWSFPMWGLGVPALLVHDVALGDLNDDGLPDVAVPGRHGVIVHMSIR
jgi:hypothetical protein